MTDQPSVKQGTATGGRRNDPCGCSHVLVRNSDTGQDEWWQVVYCPEHPPAGAP